MDHTDLDNKLHRQVSVTEGTGLMQVVDNIIYCEGWQFKAGE